MGCNQLATGNRSFCESCSVVVRKEKLKEWYQKNKDKVKESVKDFNTANPNYQKEWRMKNKEKIKGYKNKEKVVKDEELVIIIPRVCRHEPCKNFVANNLRQYCCDDCMTKQKNLDSVEWKKLNREKWNNYQNERNKRLRNKAR
jgi:hypothetical protein